MGRKTRRISHETAAVLQVFLDEPSEPRYGLELIRITELPSGSLYPILVRLENRNVLTSALEDLETAQLEGRRQRLYYSLTKYGVGEAQRQLAEWEEATRSRHAALRVRPV
jgi:DNA-binding PadR family transcriptional regulator